jgi:hypothetical protein
MTAMLVLLGHQIFFGCVADGPLAFFLVALGFSLVTLWQEWCACRSDFGFVFFQRTIERYDRELGKTTFLCTEMRAVLKALRARLRPASLNEERLRSLCALLESIALLLLLMRRYDRMKAQIYSRNREALLEAGRLILQGFETPDRFPEVSAALANFPHYDPEDWASIRPLSWAGASLRA